MVIEFNQFIVTYLRYWKKTTIIFLISNCLIQKRKGLRPETRHLFAPSQVFTPNFKKKINFSIFKIQGIRAQDCLPFAKGNQQIMYVPDWHCSPCSVSDMSSCWTLAFPHGSQCASHSMLFVLVHMFLDVNLSLNTARLSSYVKKNGYKLVSVRWGNALWRLWFLEEMLRSLRAAWPRGVGCKALEAGA